LRLRFARAHRNGELPLARQLIEHARRQATGFGAEDQRVVRLNCASLWRGRRRFDAEEARVLQGFETGGEVRVHPHLRELLIVEAGAAHRLPGELETRAAFTRWSVRAAVGAHRRMTLPVLGGFRVENSTMWKHSFCRA